MAYQVVNIYWEIPYKVMVSIILAMNKIPINLNNVHIH